MATSTTNEFQLRSLPYLDGKWLRADLQMALRSTEDLSILWNNLVKDNELFCCNISNNNNQNITNSIAINSSGNVAYMQNSGKYYCGVEKLTCICCSGYCRPTSDCNCISCHQLDKEENVTKHSGGNNNIDSNYDVPLVSDTILDSWLWSQIPSKFSIHLYQIKKKWQFFIC